MGSSSSQPKNNSEKKRMFVKRKKNPKKVKNTKMREEEEEELDLGEEMTGEEEEEEEEVRPSVKRVLSAEGRLYQDLDELRANLSEVNKDVIQIGRKILAAIESRDRELKQDLEKQQVELKQQQVHCQVEIDKLKEELRVIVFQSEPLQFSAPKQPPIVHPMKFIEEKNFQLIKDALLIHMERKFPSHVRDFRMDVVQGPMGVGKTTIVWRAVEAAVQQVGNGWIPCYVNMVNILEISNVSVKSDSQYLLVSALLFAFTDKRLYSQEYELHQIAAHIQQQLGLPENQLVRIVLHVDEFQANPKITNRLLQAARATMRERLGIVVVPVVSGIYDFSKVINVVTKPSEGSTRGITCGPLPRAELQTNFIEALQIPLENYRRDMYFQTLFQDCGDLAYLVVKLIEAVTKRPDTWAKLKAGVLLTASEGKELFELCRTTASLVYGPLRFHSIFSPETECQSDIEASQRDSFKTRTKSAMRRVTLLALSRRPVNKEESIVDLITVNKMLAVGIFRLQRVTDDSSYVQIPFMALMVMNQICRAIPLDSELEDPFDDTWQALERLAMCTLYTQVASREVDTWAKLTELRPGATFQGLEKLQFCVPKNCTFTKLLTFTNSKTVLDTRHQPINVTQIGDFRICASNQHGIDGWVNLEGKLGKVKRNIIWISQSKKQEISGWTGQLSNTKLYNGEIEKDILCKMKDVVLDLKYLYPDLKNAFVVYDVFSDRLDPTKPLKNYPLEKNEALCITRNETLDSVLGGFVARKRAINN